MTGIPTAAPVAVVDTSALLAFFDRKEPEHAGCRAAMAVVSHAVVSPMVLAELDYMLTTALGADPAQRALDYVLEKVAVRRFEIPETEPHLAAARAVMRRYPDIGLTDAMNAALAAEFRTDVLLTLDRKHFRTLRPLTAHGAYRLFPDDM
ncbi:PIN domain-containing protein [Streptomyces sp. WMMC500]|uniref:PIN domain-containing protein n=1 Tax=Streptomyces sp. WMMC500 TaxID=3015154 RepID=UPI00248BDE57|nr:PIN domain-containing protein [Streptomyces sp. WMMC500]WBB58088.1 PIN domain-containing protein [Streptomyces sp. WMMC500]